MLLHIALVAEILATIICFHCIYGKKLKWDVKTVAAVLSVLTVLEMVNYYHLSGIVRRHIVGGANCTLISGLLPPRLHSHVGDRRLWAEQPHIVVALFERQDSCF